MAYTSQGLIELGFKWEEDFTIVTYGGVGTLTWKSGSAQPSVADCEAAHTQWANKEYQRTRAAAYPSVADFMEAYTEKEIGSVSTKWDAYVIAYNKVRTDNPKS